MHRGCRAIHQKTHQSQALDALARESLATQRSSQDDSKCRAQVLNSVQEHARLQTVLQWQSAAAFEMSGNRATEPERRQEQTKIA